MKPVRITALILVIAAAATLAVLSRRGNGDVVSGTWSWEDGDDVWTFYGAGKFTRTWTDLLGSHTATGTYRIENGADLYFNGEDENGAPFSGKYYFNIYNGTVMKLSSRWFQKQR